MRRMAIALCLAALAAPAQEKKPTATAAPQMPKPAEELSVEKWFVGIWTCTGTAKTPAGERKVNNKWILKMELGGMWLILHGGPKIGPMKGKMAGLGFVGWDPVQKLHVRRDADARGGYIDFTSPGMEGDKLVFTGTGLDMGQKAEFKQTITKKGDAEFSAQWEVNGQVVSDQTCKRAAKRSVR